MKAPPLLWFAAIAGQAACYGAPLVEGELPERLSELGYVDNDEVLAYTPRFGLWSNGLDKQRWVYVPDGKKVRPRKGGWAWPDGSLLLKTFSWEGEPVETRALFREEDEWTYAVWLWEGEEAYLGDLGVPVEAELDGTAHEVPSRWTCRFCHDPGGGVLGFDALQLGDDLRDHRTQLARVPPAQELPEADPRTEEVLGYFVGNCIHCHTGEGGNLHSFSLRPDDALDNLIDQPTGSATASGIRVVPGEPEESMLYLAVSGDHDDDEIRDMPPVGVQVRDEDGIDLLGEWIEEL